MLNFNNQNKHAGNCAHWVTVEPSNRVALLLAGGDGMRLQELTRAVAGIPIPKQYCRLLHGASLLEATLARARLFAPRERISVIVNRNHLGFAKEQLDELPESNVFVQPLNRDTGPGLVFALLHLEQLYPDAIVAAFPTDHYVDDNRAFMVHTHRAANIVAQMPDKIALLGIAPDRPDTGYGYILPGDALENSNRAFRVEAFTEKPNPANARKIIARGGVWNSFVMVFKLSRMLELLAQHAPDCYRQMSKALDCPEQAAAQYRDLDSWNLSTKFLSQIPQHLVMLEVAGVGWSDWGTRESIERTYRALNLEPIWESALPALNQAVMHK